MKDYGKILTKDLDEKKRRRRRIRIATGSVLGVILLLVVFSFGVGEYLFQFALGPTDGMPNLDPGAASGEVSEDDLAIAANTEKIQAQTDAWLQQVDPQEVTIESEDGLTLYGYFYPAKEETHNYALLLHGYRSDHTSMEDYASVYGGRMGFNCLLPDMRACGKSEGTYVGMGYLDSIDVLSWIDYIEKADSEAKILVSGVSMGGATTMMVSGKEDLPDSVVCFVEDCGYTSVWDIFEHELDFLFHLPAFPLLYTASALSGLQAGYSFTEASAVDAVGASDRPMLFIHGKEDTFVSYWMLDVLYEAKTKGTKAELSVDGAGHAESFYRDPETYMSTVHDFIDPYFDLLPETK